MSSEVMAAMLKMRLEVVELSDHGRKGGPSTRKDKAIVAVEIFDKIHPGEGEKGPRSGNGRKTSANGQRRKEAKSTWRPVRGERIRQQQPLKEREFRQQQIKQEWGKSGKVPVGKISRTKTQTRITRKQVSKIIRQMIELTHLYL
jgi:hypothetical protein